MNKKCLPCRNCRLRAKFDTSPSSLAGRFWRWHIRFCPGWKVYLKSLPADEKDAVRRKYGID